MKEKKKKKANIDHFVIQLNTKSTVHKSAKNYDRKKNKKIIIKNLTL